VSAEHPPWAQTIEQMVSGWGRPPGGSPAEVVADLFEGIHEVIALQVADNPAWDEKCREYVESAQSLDRPAWSAAGRTVWAIGLWGHGDEDSALLQLVLAELELQKELRDPRENPIGGPTGPGAAYNNLGVAYIYMRAYELGVPHFRSAVAESDAKYGPDLWLQHLIDHLNLTESLLRWALHCESVGSLDQAQALAREAHECAVAFQEQARAFERSDAVSLAEALRIGAVSVHAGHLITQAEAATMAGICQNQVFGDEGSKPIVWAIRARVCRLVSDGQGCREAVAQTVKAALTGDRSVVAVATREAAILGNPEGPVWDYAQLLAQESESARQRAVSAFRTRLSLAGLQERFEQESAARAELQRKLQDALRLEADLLHAATHDALTGLPNRLLFKQRLDTVWQQERSSGKDLAVCFVDLDDLKRINDTAGHSVGDAALVRVGELLRSAVPASDTVARLSGDEFAVLMLSPGDEDTVLSWAQSLTRQSAADAASVSIGVCLVRGGHAHGADAAMAAADRQMYLAKREGKSQARLEVLR
jgi:diguanylate cyclase (GGDEF)-like protein